MLTVRGKLSWVLWIELHPVLVLELNGVLELEGDDWSLLSLVCPVPKRNCLRLIITQGDQILIVHGQIEAFDSIRMRVQERPHWGSRDGVPDNEHGVFTAISGNDPPLILRAHGGSDLVAMTLKQLLLFVHVIVDNS